MNFNCKHVYCVPEKKKDITKITRKFPLSENKSCYLKYILKIVNDSECVGDDSPAVNRHDCHVVCSVKWSHYHRMWNKDLLLWPTPWFSHSRKRICIPYSNNILAWQWHKQIYIVTEKLKWVNEFQKTIRSYQLNLICISHLQGKISQKSMSHIIKVIR